jgi:N-acetylmuramoyl-L-alanine amidase
VTAGGRIGAVVLATALAMASCAGDDDTVSRPPATSAVAVASTASPTTSVITTTTTSTVLPAPSAQAGPPGVLISPRGVVVAVIGGGPGAWVVQTPCGGSVSLASGAPVAPVDIVLDPGHGGDEPGAVGPNGLTEATLNLAVVGYAQAALARAGVRTVSTRSADYRVTLATRAEIAERARPRAFVSIHHNAEPDGPWPRPGTETFYQVASPESRRLAGLLYEEVVVALAPFNVSWVADTDTGAKYRRNLRGEDYYGILRRTPNVTAVLAELAFLSNPPEAALLARPDVQQVEGEAVSRAIVRFLTTPDPGSGFVEPYPRTTPAGPGGGAQGCVDPPL